MLNSLKEPTRWRNHSRATKIGARTWKRNELCSKGVPWCSRSRKRISPSSLSSIASFRRAKLTRAAFTTERSSAMESSRRTKPWSSTRIVPSAKTSAVRAMSSSVPRLSVGTSGWAYPSWKPGFYPAGTASGDFLRFYAERFPTVELNTTGYRLPAEEQFDRWAAQTPPGFAFAPKLPGQRPQLVAEFSARVRRLGERLGPVRVSIKSPRDEGLLELLLGSLDLSLRLAFDLEDPSWDGIEPRLAAAGAVRVNDLESEAPFRYVRLREPPYSDDDLRGWAERLRQLDVPAFVYLRHEDEPTAPRYAARLRELLARGRRRPIASRSRSSTPSAT